ncbi:hypothetical protein HK096_007386, partial [Nowakowskiella sp. JEL0078]
MAVNGSEESKNETPAKDSIPNEENSQPTQSTSPELESELDSIVSEEQKKKRLIAQMGGINPLAGLNASILLKSRSGLAQSSEEGSPSVSGRNSIGSSEVLVNEVEIRSWVIGIV